jgi:hypothetical protein
MQPVFKETLSCALARACGHQNTDFFPHGASQAMGRLLRRASLADTLDQETNQVYIASGELG